MKKYVFISSELYVSTRSNTINTATSLLTSCLKDKKSLYATELSTTQLWTEVILLGTHTAIKQLTNFSLTIDSVRVLPSSEVHDLGVILDSNLSLETHTENIPKVLFFHLRNISTNLLYAEPTCCWTSLPAFISSCLLYCNALLVGASVKPISRVQFVRNCAACILTQRRWK